MPTGIDYQDLQSALFEATDHTFSYMQEVTRSEDLYTFGLYTNGEAHFISPTANTEEGLSQIAETYQDKHNHSIEYWRGRLRWSPADWKYHLAGEVFFEDVRRILSNGWTSDFAEFHADTLRIYEICIVVLEQLRNRGKFDTIDGVIVNLFQVDIGIGTMLERAERLNNPEACRRFRGEVDMQYRLFKAR